MNSWRTKALTLALAAFATAPFLCASETLQPSQIFAQANSDYQKGDFAAAQAAYLQILREGVESGAVYYNLGNTCFKQKKLGEAIYYWELARRHMPGDQDVRENLDLANLMMVDRIEVPTSPLPIRWALRLINFLSISQQTWLVLGLFIVVNVFFGASILARNPRLAYRSVIATVLSLALLIAFGASLAWRIYQQHNTREGVIIEQKTDVRSGPGTENVTVFTVHEGLLVEVRGSSGDWYQVSLPNGWNGWVPSRSLRLL